MRASRLLLVPLLLAIAAGAQGCLAVAAGGAVVGATGAVVGTAGKVAVGTGKAIIPGESKKDREKREFREWKKAQRDG
ncbi:hypothetical protein [Caulobacter endophyticus]|uniref:hypothetical protein n=1 Tax=Caulobacter endophyticus TaxID=2172652 RepID=UPI00240EBE51|nr:hypothetical protein [Caulobacter endophyticus]MDG2529957.1 hypothetical protein [Caulobacter endophyticus]